MDPLLDQAREATSHAYAPYSGFPVGAALLTNEGKVVTGCNVENAAYGEAICAERNAITSAVTAGHLGGLRQSIAAIAVVGLKAAPCYPCGACRQVMREFGTEYVYVEDDKIAFADLLPHSFGPESLEG